MTFLYNFVWGVCVIVKLSKYKKHLSRLDGCFFVVKKGERKGSVLYAEAKTGEVLAIDD